MVFWQLLSKIKRFVTIFRISWNGPTLFSIPIGDFPPYRLLFCVVSGLIVRPSAYWVCASRGGGTDLERGYGDVRPWRPPFHASPAARKGPISSKRVSSQDPLLRKFGNFSLNSLNFHPNFSSQAPKFGNFQLTSPQIWKFSAHKPPFSEANISSQAPHFRNPGRTPLREKKLSAPPVCIPSVTDLVYAHPPNKANLTWTWMCTF